MIELTNQWFQLATELRRNLAWYSRSLASSPHPPPTLPPMPLLLHRKLPLLQILSSYLPPLFDLCHVLLLECLSSLSAYHFLLLFYAQFTALLPQEALCHHSTHIILSHFSALP